MKGCDFIEDYQGYRPPLTFARLQSEHADWARRNFGDPKLGAVGSILGAMEELGELAHATLKQSQGIRGTDEQHDASAKDAVADVIIFLADFMTRRGWDLQATMEHVWGEVKQRNWRSNPETGAA